jgi:hypothetical protein
VQLAELVHQPGHDLGVGADVGRGDVPGGSEHLLDVHEGPRDGLQLGHIELLPVDVDAALRAPYGIPAIAVFQVISSARARTSSRSTSGW